MKPTPDSTLIKSRPRILLFLRIGAIICAAFAFQTALMLLSLRSVLKGKELIVPGVIIFACLLPMSAFLKLDRTRYAPVYMVAVTFVECLMIGLILYLMFRG
jgi:hypothetical protein